MASASLPLPFSLHLILLLWKQYKQSGVIRPLNGRAGWALKRNKSLRDALVLIRQAETTPTIETRASQVLGQLGDLALGDSRWQQAGQYLGESVARALALQHPATSVRALNKLGNALTLASDYDKALAVYTEGLQLVQSGEEIALANILRLNLIRLHLASNQVAPGNHWRPAYDLFQKAAVDLLLPQSIEAPLQLE